jgi:uncharacterized membrane protein YesL
LTTPSIGGALRQAGIDFYFNSIRFAGANLVWGLGLLAVLFLAIAWLPATALGVALAVPVAGMHRMAVLLVRDEPAAFSDFVEGMRRYGLHALGIAAAGVVAGAILVTNVSIGFTSDGPLGWFLGASALYGLAALAMYLVAIWPVLVDPKRAASSVRRRLQVAALVVIGRPGRLLLLTLLIVAILAVSTVLLAGIVLFGVGYSSLVAARWVLPTADAFEARYEAARAR